MLLNAERLTSVGTPTSYLLTGLIFCAVCGGRMLSRPRDDHTRRYVCAGRRPGHQLAILAKPVDDLVAKRVVELLTTPAFREAVLDQAGPTGDEGLARALVELASAQGRLQSLDDDYYLHGVVAERRYRSIRIRLERKLEHLHVQVDVAGKQRIIIHPDPRQLWDGADLSQRRELRRLVVERVQVIAARRGARFDPSRVVLEIPSLDEVRRTPVIDQAETFVSS